MDTTVVVIIALVVVLLVVIAVVMALGRRRRAAAQREQLQDRFGPEYDRAVSGSNTRQAEARLAAAAERRDSLDIRPLSPESQDRRVQEWTSVQSMFVDAPVDAVEQADRLVADVMAERGYPTGDVSDKLELLAADHAGTVEHYRSAESLRARYHSGEGGTEDLRRAFVEYRRLFEVLVEDGADEGADRADDGADGRAAHRADADDSQGLTADEILARRDAPRT